MIPRTLFDSEHEQFRESFRRFLEAEAVPHYDRWEKDGEIDRNLWTKAGAQGYLCPTVSESYGGAGADYRYNVIVGEELSDSPARRHNTDATEPRATKPIKKLLMKLSRPPIPTITSKTVVAVSSSRMTISLKRM